MSDNLVFRPLVKEDYDIICDWWKKWEWPVIGKDFLPQDGLGGFMVEKNKKPIVAGFVFLTNSKGAWFDPIVSDPDYREDDRDSAVEQLIDGVQQFCINMGVRCIFHIGRNKGLMNKFNKLGWHVDKTPSYEIVKVIQ